MRTFGFYRAEIFAAVIYALLLLGIAVFVLFEAWQRLTSLPEVDTGLVLGFAIAALVGNGVSLVLLHRSQRESLNMRGAYLEVLGDLLARSV